MQSGWLYECSFMFWSENPYVSWLWGLYETGQARLVAGVTRRWFHLLASKIPSPNSPATACLQLLCSCYCSTVLLLLLPTGVFWGLFCGFTHSGPLIEQDRTSYCNGEVVKQEDCTYCCNEVQSQKECFVKRMESGSSCR